MCVEFPLIAIQFEFLFNFLQDVANSQIFSSIKWDHLPLCCWCCLQLYSVVFYMRSLHINAVRLHYHTLREVSVSVRNIQTAAMLTKVSLVFSSGTTPSPISGRRCLRCPSRSFGGCHRGAEGRSTCSAVWRGRTLGWCFTVLRPSDQHLELYRVPHDR